MDLFSRRIIGWQKSDSLSKEHVIKAIEKAKSNRKLTKPVVFTVTVDANMYWEIILRQHKQHILSAAIQTKVILGIMHV